MQIIDLNILWQADQAGELPGYKGGLVRGALGYALRKRFCRQNFDNPCKRCGTRPDCVYALFFEPVATDTSGGKLLQGEGFADSARPFIVDIQNFQRHFQEGDSFRFSIRLLGMDETILEVMNLVFADIGIAGLGKFKLPGSFSLEAAAYTQDLLLTSFLPAHLVNDENGLLDALTLNFQTWTVLKANGEILHRFDPSVFARAVLRRTRQLIALYGETYEYQQLMKYYDQLLSMWQSVKVDFDRTEFKKWGRTSTRQKQTYEVEGFTGMVRLLGVPQVWLPFLEWSQLLHVGKGATFGLGAVVIQE